MCLKKEQIININSRCSNGWELDVQYCLMHGEKILIKRIDLDEQNFFEFSLRYNYNKQISLHISKFFHKPEETFASTSGMGKNKVLDDTPVARKNVNKLIEYTKELTDEKLLEINKNTEVSKSNGLILQSEDF